MKKELPPISYPKLIRFVEKAYYRLEKIYFQIDANVALMENTRLMTSKIERALGTEVDRIGEVLGDLGDQLFFLGAERKRIFGLTEEHKKKLAKELFRKAGLASAPPAKLNFDPDKEFRLPRRKKKNK